MNSTKRLKVFFSATVLSVLVFFSISFVTVLTHILPFHYYRSNESYKLEIGFPFTFYEQFWLNGSNLPNSGWTLNNLFYDCLLTWLVVTGLYYGIQRRKMDSH